MTTSELVEDGHYWMRRAPDHPWCMTLVKIHKFPQVLANEGRVPHYASIGKTYAEPVPTDAEFVGPISEPKR